MRAGYTWLGAEPQSRIRRRAWIPLVFFSVVVLSFCGWYFHDSPFVSTVASSVGGWASYQPAVIGDLLDPDVVLSTPGASLADQEHSAFVPISMQVPPTADQYFKIVIQCHGDIIGDPVRCPPAYMVHFRGPIAHNIPPVNALYSHDAAAGRTVIDCYLPLAGNYEVWVWPDRLEDGECPENNPVGPLGAVEGSGTTRVRVTDGAEEDHMRRCTEDDYQGDMPGRWVSVGHIREKYRPYFPHLQNSSDMPQYIYLPYKCKREPLSYDRIKKSHIRNVAYIGDSILRTTFCNHLYPGMNNGTIGGDCTYSSDVHGYHYSNKHFEVGQQTFTTRFVDNHAWELAPHIADLDGITQIIVNIGMWFGAVAEQDYINNVGLVLDELYEKFGDKPHYTWVDTYSVSPAVMCYQNMRRVKMRRHGEWAAIALDDWRDKHPSVTVNQIRSFPIIDSRPETTSDGRCVGGVRFAKNRHWVREGGLPSLSTRPLVGDADNAVMEAVYDYWMMTARPGEVEVAAADLEPGTGR